MGAARSRSHRAGGRPSTRTRMLLLHAVRVAVAAEARGGPRQGAHTFVFGVTRLTPPGRPTERPPRAASEASGRFSRSEPSGRVGKSEASGRFSRSEPSGRFGKSEASGRVPAR